ncbi:hypothetical protein F4777DRAFT_535099 [Nemania sp. FL0916]|nr:hypothetical protein F4777DRAFT_535099 [Nemania sp. FL0916]
MGRVAKAAVAREQEAAMGGGKRAQRTQVLHDLELKHQKNSHEAKILVKDEDLRRLRVRILLLRDENGELRDQVEQSSKTNAKLGSRCDDLNSQVEAKIALARSQEEQLRKHEREYTNLQAELQSMVNVNEHSANVLAEKLALTRELANLKPEIEHLRSQVNHQQALLAEKLSLERQVNTLEVELANEKKASRRALQNRESNDRVEDELRKQLREAMKNLTTETAERERLQDQLEQRIRTHAIAIQDQDNTRESEADLRKRLQEAQRQLREEKEAKETLSEELQTAQRALKKSQQYEAGSTAEADLRAQLIETQKSLTMIQERNNKRHEEQQAVVSQLEQQNEKLEKKLDKARGRFHEIQEELKKTQAELRKAQQQQARQSSNPDNAKPTAKAQAIRKRKAQETTSDFASIEIQTPSAEGGAKSRQVTKKIVFEPTAVGEKSAFSITPFLNRSKNASSSDEAADEDDGLVEDSILGPRQGSEPSDLMMSKAITSPAETVTQTEPTTATQPETEKSQAAPKARGRPKKALGDATAAKKNTMTQKAPKKILKTKSNPEKASTSAVESGQQENDSVAKESEPVEKTMTVKFDLAPPQSQNESNNDSSLNSEVPKKKKRKVLGSTKTLFDEDDGGEAPALAAPTAAITAAAAAKPAKIKLGNASGNVKRVKAPLGGGGGQKNAFAGSGSVSFSPLKRDRRGVGASFLA